MAHALIDAYETLTTRPWDHHARRHSRLAANRGEV